MKSPARSRMSFNKEKMMMWFRYLIFLLALATFIVAIVYWEQAISKWNKQFYDGDGATNFFTTQAYSNTNDVFKEAQKNKAIAYLFGFITLIFVLMLLAMKHY